MTTHSPVRLRDDDGQTHEVSLVQWRRLEDGNWWGQVTTDNAGEPVTFWVPASRLEPLPGQDYGLSGDIQVTATPARDRKGQP